MIQQDFEVLVNFFRKNKDKQYNKTQLINALREENEGILNQVFDDIYIRNNDYNALDWLAFFIKGRFFGSDISYIGPCDLEVFDAVFNPVERFSGNFKLVGSITDEEDTEIDFEFTKDDGSKISFDPYTMRLLRKN